MEGGRGLLHGQSGWIFLSPTINWLGKGPDEGKPVTIWAVWMLTPTQCWLEGKPVSSWLQVNPFQNLSSLKSGAIKQRIKTHWSSAVPLKGEGIKLGLLHIAFSMHCSRHKAGTDEDAGEISWKSSLSISEWKRISSETCPLLPLPRILQLYLNLQMSRGEVAADFHRAGFAASQTTPRCRGGSGGFLLLPPQLNQGPPGELKSHV